MSESEKNDFPVMPPPPQREARTVREYFDRIPEESEKTLLDKKHAAQEEEQDITEEVELQDFLMEHGPAAEVLHI